MFIDIINNFNTIDTFIYCLLEIDMLSIYYINYENAKIN